VQRPNNEPRNSSDHADPRLFHATSRTPSTTHRCRSAARPTRRLKIIDGSFAANSAWLVLAAIAFNLTRAAGTIASVFHAKATTATIRRQLIAVPARLATSARRLVLHLPKDWPWWDSWQGLFNATCGPPTPTTT
jgi:hypothetical protein